MLFNKQKKEEKNYNVDLTLSMKRSFLGHIRPEYRFIHADIRGDLLEITVYQDKEVTEDDKDFLNCNGTSEILPDYPEVNREIINLIYSKEHLLSISKKFTRGTVFYMRWEEALWEE